MVDVRCGNGGDKVAICHVPLGNPANAKTICVSSNALNTFLGKDSYLGNCTSGRVVKPAEAQEVIAKSTVYPNPTTDKINVQLTNTEGSKAEILLINANGMTVIRKTVQLTSANQQLQMNIGKYAPGVYLLKIVTEKGTKTEKVIVRR